MCIGSSWVPTLCEPTFEDTCCLTYSVYPSSTVPTTSLPSTSSIVITGIGSLNVGLNPKLGWLKNSYNAATLTFISGLLCSFLKVSGAITIGPSSPGW